MGFISDTPKVGYSAPRVSNCLDEDQLGLLVDQPSDIFWVVAGVQPPDLDAQTREKRLETAVRAAVQVPRRDDVIAGLGQQDYGLEYSPLPRTCSDRCRSAFKSSTALLENL